MHHNALSPASSPKEVEKGSFAHTLATTLDQAMRSARFGKWVLVAPPHFLFNDLAIHELSERLRDDVRVPVSGGQSIREDRKGAP